MNVEILEDAYFLKLRGLKNKGIEGLVVKLFKLCSTLVSEENDMNLSHDSVTQRDCDTTR